MATSTVGTMADVRNPKSIMVLVNHAKYRFLLAAGNNKEASAQAVEAAGYSEPNPTPINTLHTVKAVNIPVTSLALCPHEAEANMVNMMRIIVPHNMAARRE
ncbi:hypothetical protein WICPIJ_003770 [Wickerhamomyces pijperi]|uniref:Uncharacterized protein n=1 Tax=Wickerhamomyces pijperi TaxID=599730 RepID=A0A9P8TNZ2_WICPI|nr:hypothetical protein WICPIJ_003770 [Wickerhamomyces pijperi]